MARSVSSVAGRLRATPSALRGAPRAIRSAPAVLRGAPGALLGATTAAGQELAWLAAHAVTYPIGLLSEQAVAEDPRYRIDTLPPVIRGLITGDINAAGRPVLLVHGIGDNRSAFSILRRTLRRRGYGRISTVNYSPLTTDIRTCGYCFRNDPRIRGSRYCATVVEAPSRSSPVTS